MAQNTSMEEFEALLNESFEIDTPEEGSVVTGKVIAIEAGQAIIDVGGKVRTLTPDERQAWVDAMKPVWEQFADDVGQDMIDAAQSLN